MHAPFSRFSEYFLAVARTGSLRKAADSLYISVSAVHRQIVLAEEELGVELFERFPNGMKLTLAGELLYSDLRKWQKDFRQTCIRFDEIQGLKRGTIEIGTVEALAEGILVDCIAAMSEEFPWINFQINVNTSERVAQSIANTEVDFGLVLDPKQHAHLDVLAFVEIPIGIAFAPTHELASKKNPKLSDTLEYKHIIVDAPLVIQDRVDAIYRHHQLSPLHTLVCNDIEMIRSLLKRGLGISIVSYLDVINTVKANQLIFIPIKNKNLQPITLALCTASKRQLSRAAQVMLKYITTAMNRLVNDDENR